MNRRKFIKSGAIWVPAIVGLKAKSQVLTLADPAVNPTRISEGESLKDSYQYGETDGGSVNAGDNWYYWGYSFAATASYTLSRFRVWASQLGSPSYNATPYIYSDSSSEPGSALSGGSGTLFALSSAPAAGSPAGFDLNGFSCSISSGTTYWLVLYCSGYSATNNLRLWGNIEAGMYAKRNDTGLTPWGNTAGNYRLGWEAYGS